MTGALSAAGTAAGLVAFPATAAIVGSVIAALRAPGPKLTSGVQHFAAGVVLAALVGEVLPDLRGQGRLGWAVVGFAAGTAVLLTLGALSRRVESRDTPPGSSRLPAGLLAAVGIDLLLDGVLVGLGASLGAKQGLILTIALTIEILFVGLSVTLELTGNGIGKLRAVVVTSLIGLATAVGAIGAALALHGANPTVLALVLAFGAAALLYLVVEELLIEAHEQAETVALSAMFFLGFLIIYVLGAL